jgi:hypothetical protein
VSYHTEVMLTDPFTGRNVGIDEELAPVIKQLWALGIETTSSCQGPPLYDRAIICFAEPIGFDESPDSWEVDADDPADWDRWCKAADAWDASRPSGARQLFDLMTGGSWAHMTARWTWNMGGDDPGPGSVLLLPAPDLPVLAKALAELAEPMPARSG